MLCFSTPKRCLSKLGSKHEVTVAHVTDTKLMLKASSHKIHWRICTQMQHGMMYYKRDGRTEGTLL